MALRVLIILAFLAAWFVPLIIAALYKLPHQGSIAVLSLLLGWTGAGWLAALVIAVGGAIRATRPPAAAYATGPQASAPHVSAPAQRPAPARAATQARTPTQARGPAQPEPPAQATWPQTAPTAPTDRAPSPEPGPLPPSWPEEPR